MNSSRKGITTCNPTDNRRHPRSGLGDIKWATGHKTTKNRINCAKWDTGTQYMNKIPLRRNHRYGIWNVRINSTPKKTPNKRTRNGDPQYIHIGVGRNALEERRIFLKQRENVVYFSRPERESRNEVAFIVSSKIQNIKVHRWI